MYHNLFSLLLDVWVFQIFAIANNNTVMNIVLESLVGAFQTFLTTIYGKEIYFTWHPSKYTLCQKFNETVLPLLHAVPSSIFYSMLFHWKMLVITTILIYFLSTSGWGSRAVLSNWNIVQTYIQCKTYCIFSSRHIKKRLNRWN